MKFNLNGYMRVKLTGFGRKILEDEHNYYNEMRPKDKRQPFELKLDKDGWYKDQAWCIFNTFGQHIQMGKETPFETEIEIEC